MADLYSRISDECQKKGINSNELGRLLSLKKGPLTDWKNQKSKPTLDQLIKMCEIFATSSDYLLFGTEHKDITSDEYMILEKYIALSPYDKEEINALIDFKLQHTKSVSGDKSKSSPSQGLDTKHGNVS